MKRIGALVVLGIVITPFVRDFTAMAAPVTPGSAVSDAELIVPAPGQPEMSVVAEACATSMGDCGDEAIQAGFDALAQCPTPSDGQFELVCDDDGNMVGLLVVCDRTLVY